jgi:hypothetical protein
VSLYTADPASVHALPSLRTLCSPTTPLPSPSSPSRLPHADSTWRPTAPTTLAYQVIPPSVNSESAPTGTLLGTARRTFDKTAAVPTLAQQLKAAPDYSLQAPRLQRLTEYSASLFSWLLFLCYLLTCSSADTGRLHFPNDCRASLSAVLQTLSTREIPFTCRTHSSSCVLAIAGRSALVVSLRSRSVMRSKPNLLDRELIDKAVQRGVIVFEFVFSPFPQQTRADHNFLALVAA